MKFAIISDLHANLAAFKQVLQDAAESGAEAVVCLGDIVGYGPLPEETLLLARKTLFLAVSGNHDDAVSGRLDASSFIDLAYEAAERHRRQLSKESLSYLKSLPHTAEIEGAVISHGDLTQPDAFNYIDSEEAAAANFAYSSAQLIFVGHTHTPSIHITGNSGRVYSLAAQDFVVEEGKRYIVNPGSVGYPREEGGKCLSSYIIYDSSEKTVKFRFLPFSVSSVMQRGRMKPRAVALPIAISGALAAAAVLALFYSRGKSLPSPEGRPVAAITAEESRKVAEKTLTLAPSYKTVRANLKLKKGSPSAQVETVFLDAGGNTVETSSKKVKEKFSSAVKIPKGALSVKFKVFKTDYINAPQILVFDPTAE